MYKKYGFKINKKVLASFDTRTFLIILAVGGGFEPTHGAISHST